MESIFIEIDKDQLHCKQNIVIGSIYQPPGTDIKLFQEKLKNILTTIQRQNKLCYLLGDYNIDLIHCETHNSTAEFYDMMSSFSFIPLITRPTRITPTSASLIDNIFTNDHINLINSLQGILVTDITDHYPIFYIDSLIKETNIWISKRKYTAQNKTKFKRALSSVDWVDLCQIQNTNHSLDLFHNKIREIHHS